MLIVAKANGNIHIHKSEIDTDLIVEKQKHLWVFALPTSIPGVS